MILVVYAHCSDTQVDYAPSFVSYFFHLNDFGAVGVDLFFVISGFIICGMSHKYLGKVNAIQFFVKRFTRIAPLYWLVSAGWFLYDHNHGIRGWLKTIFFLPVFDFSQVFIKPVMFVGWTLSFEFYFYTVTAILLAFGKKQYIQQLILFFLAMIIAGRIFPYEYSFWTFITNPITAEFVFGCLIWILYSRFQHYLLNWAPWFLIAGIILFLLNIYFMPVADISESFLTLNGVLAAKRILLWGIPSSLLLLGVVLSEKRYALKFSKWIILTGDASYSIYLFHLPLVKLFYRTWSHYPYLYSEVLVILTSVLVCFSGYLLYRLIERPLLLWLTHLIVPKLKKAY